MMASNLSKRFDSLFASAFSSSAMPTIADVARESGVSIATVSNVLNDGPKPVRDVTRQRVLTAARGLNYHPNAMAQGLVRRRMNTIGIYYHVVETVDLTANAYGVAILQGVLTATADLGYNLMFFTRPWRGAARSAAAFRDRRADGLLVVAPTTDSDMLVSLQELGLTLVTISPAHPGQLPCVDVDDAAGARLAVEHLLGLGHVRIAHLTGNRNMRSAEIRRREFLRVTRAAGAAVPAEYVVESAYDGATACAATQRLLSLPERPTAIFAANDIIAQGVIAEAREMGLDVPRDLSVVGYDDTAPAAPVRPALTTVRQPLTEIGARAARLLIDRIEERAPADTRIVMEPELVVRATTARAPSAPPG